MRYYAIIIEGAPSLTFPVVPGAIVPGAQFCTVVNGVNDPAALRCVIQMELKPAHTGVPGGFVRLYGVDLNMIDQQNILVGMPISIYGGFWYGLPLASAEAPFAGLLVSGTINAAFGNWKGNEMTLDLIIGSAGMSNSSGGGGAGSSTPESAETPQIARLVARNAKVGRARRIGPPRPGQQDIGDALGAIGSDLGGLASALAGVFGGGGWMGTAQNIIHDFTQGKPLESAIQQTLTTAFKGAQIDTSLITKGLTLPYHDAGFYQTLPQYAGYIKQLSKSIQGGGGIGGAIAGAAGALGGMLGGGGAGGANASAYGLGPAPLIDLGGIAGAVGSAASALGGGGGSDYRGIDLYPFRGKIVAFDGTQPYNYVDLQYYDIIGQPTWSGQEEGKPLINFLVPMRADITPISQVTLPAGTLQGEAPSKNMNALYPSTLAQRANMNFSGSIIQLDRVMIVADSRNPAGESWCLSCTGHSAGAMSGSSVPMVSGLSNAAPLTNQQTIGRLVARNSRINVGSHPRR